MLNPGLPPNEWCDTTPIEHTNVYLGKSYGLQNCFHPRGKDRVVSPTKLKRHVRLLHHCDLMAMPMEYSKEIKIIIKAKNFNPAGKILISGFHSALGETGFIVLRHLVAQKQTQSIGYVMSPLLPPHIFLSKDRLLLPIELYSFEERFILLFPRMQPHQAEWAPFTEAVADWAIDQQLQEAILLGGMDKQFATASEEYRSAYTTAYRPKAKQMELPLLEEGRGIYGPLALLLTNFEIRDFPAVAVLPYAERGRPDPRAASVAISLLNRFYELTISKEDLLRDAETIEKEIRQLLDRQHEQEEERNARGMFV